MIKRTLYFGNPAYLSLRDRQLVVKRNNEELKTVPIEDVGYVVLDHRQITITQGAISELVENNCAVVTCDTKHLPTGLVLPLSGNTLQSERFQSQIEASLPLKKQLWQQTIQKKVLNQAAVLRIKQGLEAKNMLAWASSVRSGDADNREAVAAAYYWKELFPDIPGFTRDREGVPPNNLLNYGYAILRAVVARSLVCSGLIPTLGIFHHNRYNAYCLADDIMEPYRPIVDKLVFEIVAEAEICPEELNKEQKIRLLQIPVLDTIIEGVRSPLMNAVATTTASLAKCFMGVTKKILYPEVLDESI